MIFQESISGLSTEFWKIKPNLEFLIKLKLMIMQTRKLLRTTGGISMIMLFVAVVTLMSCGKDDDPKRTFAPPTIEITSPTDLSNLQALVASPFSFTISVEAEAGLSSVSLNGTNIKTYSGSETEDSFIHDYTPTENGTISLVFVVEDAKGVTTASASISLEAVGDVGFLLADFAGDLGSSVELNTIDPTNWDGGRRIFTFDVNNNLAPTTATFEIVNDQFTAETGAANPDAQAVLEYQGKAFKVVKQATSSEASWGWAGWSHIMFDLKATIPQATIEALPQMNATSDGLTTGTKYVEVDVYYEDTEENPFSAIVANDPERGEATPFGSDRTKGYSFFLMLTKHADHRLNPDGAGMYIGYRKYITEANKWITLRFDEFYNENAGNNYPTSESSAGPDEIDGIKIIAGGGYGDGQTNNAIYFRNLRIVDAE